MNSRFLFPDYQVRLKILLIKMLKWSILKNFIYDLKLLNYNCRMLTQWYTVLAVQRTPVCLQRIE